MNIVIENVLMNTAKRFGKAKIEDKSLKIKYAGSESIHCLTPVTVSNAEICVMGVVKPFKVSRKPITIVKDVNGIAYVIHNTDKKVQWYKVDNNAYFIFDYEMSAKGEDDHYEFLTGMLSKTVSLHELLGTFPDFFSELDNLDTYSLVTIEDLIDLSNKRFSPFSEVADYVNGSPNFSRALVVLIRENKQKVWVGSRDNIHNDFSVFELSQLLPDVSVKTPNLQDGGYVEENTITPTASAWMDMEDVELVANENQTAFTDEHLSEILVSLQSGNEAQRKYANINLNTVMTHPSISGSISPALWAEAVKVYRRMGESRTLPKLSSVAESTLERDFENDLYNLLGRYAVKGLNVPAVLGRIMDAEDKDER